MKATITALTGRFGFHAGLFLIACAGFLFRTVPLYDDVIQQDRVRFQGIDAYYHVRLTTYLVEHYPDRLEFDSIRKHPGGQRVDVYPAFDLLTGTAAIIAGAGAPSKRTVELTLAYIPPVLGTLTLLFLGFAGRRLGGTAGGLAAASLVAFLPGGTLTQTVLGFSDHHALETLLLSVCWYLLIRLLADRRPLRNDLAYLLLLGVACAAYILTWEGSPILPAVIMSTIGIQLLTSGHTQQETALITLRLTIVSAATILVLLLIGFSSPMVQVSSILFLFLPILPAFRWGITQWLPTATTIFQHIIWIFLLGALAVGAFAVLPEKAQQTLLINVGRLNPSVTAQTVSEMRPLITNPHLLWQFLGPALYWGGIGLLVSILLFWKKCPPHILLVIVMGLFFIPSALFQIRFSSAASLSLGLLSAIVVGISFQDFRTPVLQKIFNRQIVRFGLLAVWVITVPLWSLVESLDSALIDRGPSQDVSETMEWLREQTPDPVGSETLGTSPTYGVLNWWDAGYYLTTLAGRIPTSNPSQAGARYVANMYLDTLGNGTVARLREDSIRYVLTHASLALLPNTTYRIEGTYQVLPVWAGKPERDLLRTVYFPMPDGSYDPRFAYLPSYFKGLHVRLLLYGGAETTPTAENIWAIQTEMFRHPSGRDLERVVSAQSFASYDMAARFMERRSDPSWSIVSFSPFDTCVPLEGLDGIEEVFRSPTDVISLPSLPGPVPVLRVFQITPTE